MRVVILTMTHFPDRSLMVLECGAAIEYSANAWSRDR